MKQGTKYGREAIQLAGSIFASSGVLMLVILMIWWAVAGFQDGYQALMILGPGFLGLGSGFLIFDLKKRRTAQKLLEEGRFVWGEIVALEYNGFIRVNGRYPWYAKVRYLDGAGQVHTFKSRCISSRTAPNLVGRRVKVYVDSDYRRSHVDLNSIEA